MRFFVASFLLVSAPLFAADATKPHPHHGKVNTYAGEPPVIKLTDDQLKKVNAGETAYTQTAQDSGGNAVAIFKVNASPENVRKIIRDFKSYPKWIDDIDKDEGKGIKVYKEEGDKVWVEFNIKAKKFGITKRLTYFIEHNFPIESKGWGTWKLDYSRESDLDDSAGFWRVDAVPGNPNQSLVYYSVDMRISGILSWFKGMIVDEGIEKATQWVKKAAAAQPTTTTAAGASK